jgi:hypothetical protein
MKSMPWSRLCLALALSLVGRALATPLEKELVSADAKWILHLDADQLRAGKTGSYLLEQILNPKSAKLRDDLKRELDFELNWEKIQAITAYGSQYEPRRDSSGVLLLRTRLALAPALEAAIERAHPALRVERLEAGPTPLYCVNGDLLVAPQPGGLYAMSKSRDALQHARDVLAGQAASQGAGRLLEGYGAVPASFFFFGVAADFSQNAALPPKAAVLKQAEGGRLILGELGESLFVDLTIRARDEEVAQQIQQVFQGLLALAALSQEQKPELRELTQAARITAAERLVTVGLEIPVAKALQKLSQQR